MASLIQRLKTLQVETEVELPDLSGLTLEDLAKEKISFGQKHQGDTYDVAWEDQQWINFMVTKYGSSKVLAHRRLLRYVELKVEEHENARQAIPVMPPRASQAGYVDGTTDPSGRKFIQPKAKTRPSQPYRDLSVVVDGDEESEYEMYTSGTMDQPPLSQDPDFQAMQQRMLHMEDALTKVIRHLEDKTSTQS